MSKKFCECCGIELDSEEGYITTRIKNLTGIHRFCDSICLVDYLKQNNIIKTRWIQRQ